MSKNEIKQIIEHIAGKEYISQEQEELSQRVEEKCTGFGYTIKKMGSITKGTAISGSDIDLLAIIPKEKSKHDASTSLNHLGELLVSFNPQIGNHSVIIRKNGVGIDVVPAKKTSVDDQYTIPKKRGNEWISRGQNAFTKSFNELDSSLNGKLSAAVKILKLWNYRKTTLDLSSIALEKVAHDALKTGNTPETSIEVTLKCFKELNEQITKTIKHPSGGSQLNKLGMKDKVKWKKVISRDLEKLNTLELEKWKQVLGPGFHI